MAWEVVTLSNDMEERSMKSKVLVLIFSFIGATNLYPQAQTAPARAPSPVAPVQGPTKPSQNQPALPNRQSPFSTVSPNAFVTNAPGMVPQSGGATNPFGVSPNQPGALGGEPAPGLDRDDFRFARTNLEMLPLFSVIFCSMFGA